MYTQLRRCQSITNVMFFSPQLISKYIEQVSNLANEYLNLSCSCQFFHFLLTLSDMGEGATLAILIAAYSALKNDKIF